MRKGDYQVFGGNGRSGYHSDFLQEQPCIVIGRVGAHCGNAHIAAAKSWITDNAIYSRWCSSNTDLRFYRYYFEYLNLNQLSGGSGQPYVSQGLLNPLLVPLLSLAEQQLVANLLDEALTRCAGLHKTINEALTLSSALRQSVLRNAFIGELVPQETSDKAGQRGRIWTEVVMPNNSRAIVGASFGLLHGPP